jgi:hypothetical protein
MFFMNMPYVIFVILIIFLINIGGWFRLNIYGSISVKWTVIDLAITDLALLIFLVIKSIIGF